MTFLPVVDRELRVNARRSKTYWLRLAAAVGALGICVWVCLFQSRMQASISLGHLLFEDLSVLALGYCLLVGPFITADSMSEEKREGTLGLLFLTDLNSYDVVLGKWIATSLAGLYGLLAILPALGLPLLMGGVTPGEYARIALSVVNAILFSLTAGMLVSTLSREQTKAILGSVVLILGLSGLLPGLMTVISTHFFTRPMVGFPRIALLSPAYSGYLAMDTSFRSSPRDFWMSVGCIHGLSWIFMLVTVLLVPRLWREQHEGKPITSRWLWRLGYTSGWRRRFASRLERNPIYAMAARMRWPHWVFWCLVSLVGINVSWFVYGYRSNSNTFQLHQFFGNALIFTNRVWITTMACRFILESRRTGALELLLTTPIPVKTLLRGHWRSLWYYFFWPIVGIGVLHLLLVHAYRRLGNTGLPTFWTMDIYALMALRSFSCFLADVVALSFVGTWLSLSSRKPTFAMLRTFAFVILIPYAIGRFAPTLTQSLKLAGLFSYLPDWTAWILKDLLFAGWAWWRLRTRFRPAAAQTLGSSGSAWRFRARLPLRQAHTPELAVAADAVREP